MSQAVVRNGRNWGIWRNVCVVLLGRIGDKTQIATVAFAARFDSIISVMLRYDFRDDVGQCASGLYLVISWRPSLPIALIHKNWCGHFLGHWYCDTSCTALFLLIHRRKSRIPDLKNGIFYGKMILNLLIYQMMLVANAL